MALRDPLPGQTIEMFRGLDSLNDPQSLTPDTWSASLNVAVSITGNALPLRSPANFNTALVNSLPILSGTYYNRAAGGEFLFDTQTVGTTNVSTYATTGGANTLLRSGQANARWQSVNVNDRSYRVNGTEFVQVVTSNAVYAVGISAPAAAPTLSFASGGAGAVNSGVTVSYAYRNSGTGHVGEASPVSASSGATTAGSTSLKLRVAVTASTQSGVDGIVLFITQDGGSVRYLYIDTNGDPVVNSNTTGNIDISIALLTNLNFNVEETVFNVPPPAGLTFIGTWKNRLVGALNRSFYYSGFDQIFYGQPWEAWPPLNELPIPNKGEYAKGGVDTPVGWLALSDRDAYLVTGSPTDKVDSGENTLQVTEQMRQMSWALGTRSPLSIKKTPFGVIWLDQDKHLQFWPFQGQPIEISMGLRPDLDAIQDTDAARAMVEGEWFPSGDFGGFYVLTGSTSGSLNNRMWVITIVKTGNDLFMAGGPSDIAAQCVFSGLSSGANKCLIGVTDRLREILAFDTQGAGWPSGTQIYFEILANNQSLWSTLSALRYDADNGQWITVQSREFTGRNTPDTNIRTLWIQKRGGSYYGVVNQYGTRQKLRFNFATDDAARQELLNLKLISQAKRRIV